MKRLLAALFALALSICAPAAQTFPGHPSLNSMQIGQGVNALPIWIPLGPGLTTAGNVLNVAPGVALTGLTIYRVTDNGVKCDGVTDDTTAFKNIASAISTAGGNALIIFPANANCIVLNSGQSFTSNLFVLFDFQLGVSNIVVQGNGATITNGHTFVSPDTFYNFYCKCTNFYLDNIKFVQTNGVTLPAAQPYGTVGLFTFNASTNIVVTNVSLTGGEVPILNASTTGVSLVNITSNNSVYGYAANGCISCTIPGGVNDLFVANLVVPSTHDRAVFLKGVDTANITVASKNAGSNDLLLSSETTGQVDQNITINYRVLPRTSGTPLSYATIGTGSLCTTSCANSIWRNITINIHADLSGDATVGPLVQFVKSTTSSLGLTFDNIKINGLVTGIPSASGHLFDLFQAADSPWTGETAKNIIIGPFSTAGSATPDFRVDLAPFNSSLCGNLVLQDIPNFGGALTLVNGTNFATIARTMNAHFSNTGTNPLSSCFGGTNSASFLYNATAWTPTLVGSTSGSWTLSTASGSYEQNGRHITARFTIIASGSSSPVGNIVIGGLPVAAGNTSNDNAGCWIIEQSGLTNATGFTTYAGLIVPGTSNILLVENGSGKTAQPAPVGESVATPFMIGACNYHS